MRAICFYASQKGVDTKAVKTWIQLCAPGDSYSVAFFLCLESIAVKNYFLYKKSIAWLSIVEPQLH